MAGMNVVNLVGRVGQDPDYRVFNSGDKVIEFSLATSESWRDKNTGERKEKTQWHRVKILGEGPVKVAKDYVRKGDLIGIEGELQYRQWEKDGEKRTMAEVVVGPFKGRLHLLGSKEDNGGGSRDNGDRGRRDDRDRDDRRDHDRGGYGRGNAGSTGYNRDLDDEIPFAPEFR